MVKLTSLPEVGALLNLTLPEGPLGNSKVPSSEPGKCECKQRGEVNKGG